MNRELKAAVEAILAGEMAGSLRGSAEAMSRHYRVGGRSDATINLAAYLTARLPATYAAVSAVLEEVARRRPGFAPATVLDAGSGPGTASWAAFDRWPGLGHATMADTNRAFLDLALRIAAHSGNPGLAGAAGRLMDMGDLGPAERVDLVIAAYALAEIPELKLARSLDALWLATASVLVLVEPGTPAGFARIRQMRGLLLAAGAVVLGPCPHDGPCPMTGDDWCHFSVRLPRSRAHMHAKSAQVPFEDEKFAWLAVSRDGAPAGGARVLAPPRQTKADITLRLCTPSGFEMRRIARRDAAAYKEYRKTEWGDFLPDHRTENT